MTDLANAILGDIITTDRDPLYIGDSLAAIRRQKKLSTSEIKKASGVTVHEFGDTTNMHFMHIGWHFIPKDQPHDALKEHFKTHYDYQINHDVLTSLNTVEFNPTDLCNRRCYMCPRSDEELYPNNNEHLDINAHHAVIDDLVKHQFKGVIIYSGWGEPTLNPKIFEMIRYAADNLPECHITCYTNFDVFRKGKLPGYGKTDFGDLIDAGVHQVDIDIYDGDEMLVEVLKKIKPWIGQICMKLNLQYRQKQSAWVNRGGIMATNKTIKNSMPCFITSSKAFVHYTGELISCCHEWDRLIPAIGHVSETPFSELWTATHFNELRHLLNESRANGPSPCQICDARAGTGRDRYIEAQQILLDKHG
jgi:MoaA/NifB/PqqE/SkfB family radical SAM enzyme